MVERDYLQPLLQTHEYDRLREKTKSYRDRKQSSFYKNKCVFDGTEQQQINDIYARLWRLAIFYFGSQIDDLKTRAANPQQHSHLSQWAQLIDKKENDLKSFRENLEREAQEVAQAVSRTAEDFNQEKAAQVARDQEDNARRQAIYAIQEGDAALRRQDYAEAMRIWTGATRQPMSLKDDNGLPIASTAMALIGVLYANGTGVTQDLDKALNSFKKAEANGNPNVHDNINRLQAILEERRRVAALAVDISNMLTNQQGFDDNAVLVFARIKGSEQVSLKLNGSVTFADGKATLCVGAAMPEDVINQRYMVSPRLSAFLQERISATESISDLQVLAPWTNKSCIMRTDTWDVYDVNKVGLTTHSSDNLIWLRDNLKTTLRLIAVIPLADFAKDQADQAAAEAAAREKIAQEQQKRTEEAEQQRSRLLAQQKQIFDLLSAGKGLDSTLYFLARGGAATKEVCYVHGDNRAEVVMGIHLSNDPLIDPLFANGGVGFALDNADAVFARMQHNGCGLVMGSRTELKPIIDAWKQLGQPITALSMTYTKDEVKRLVDLSNQKMEADKRAAALAEQRRQEEAVAEAQERKQSMREFPFRAVITCTSSGNSPGPIGVCFQSDSVSTDLEIRNRDDYHLYKGWDVSGLARGGPDINIDLHNKFSITAQNANDFFVLNVQIFDRETNHKIYEKSVSQFGVVKVTN